MSSLGVEGPISSLLLILLVLVLVGMVVALAIDSSLGTKGYRPRRWNGRRWPSDVRRPSDVRDVGQQMHAVMAAKFERRRLLSKAEYRLFKLIEEEVSTVGHGYRAFAQTNLGEILSSSDRKAFASINSKRVDILVVDGGGWPVAAVEYQGDGHYQGTAAARDAVKKEALRKAGVRYIEVCSGDRPEQVRTRVREQMGWSVAAPTPSASTEDAPARPHFGTTGLSPELSGSH